VFAFCEAELQAIRQLAINKTLIIKIFGFIAKPPYRRAFQNDAGRQTTCKIAAVV
jgi:hypothetical protein